MIADGGGTTADPLSSLEGTHFGTRLPILFESEEFMRFSQLPIVIGPTLVTLTLAPLWEGIGTICRGFKAKAFALRFQCCGGWVCISVIADLCHGVGDRASAAITCAVVPHAYPEISDMVLWPMPLEKVLAVVTPWPGTYGVGDGADESCATGCH